MDTSKIQSLIVDQALVCKIDKNLAQAIAFTESGFDTTKIRYEPLWAHFLNIEKYAKQLGITPGTERMAQSCSWGVFQIMGTVARELGYNGALTLLIQPSLGILYGCKKLQALSNKYTQESDIISSFNQGSPVKINGVYKNLDYVRKVTDRLTYLRKV